VIGDYQTRVIIESVSRTPAASGQPVETWTEYARIWVKVTDQHGREAQMMRENVPEASAVWTCWYKSGVTTAMRGKIGTRYFEILAVTNVEEQNRIMKLLVKETARANR
jgi:SPP1 family predicted phage head-tail adaptor